MAAEAELQKVDDVLTTEAKSAKLSENDSGKDKKTKAKEMATKIAKAIGSHAKDLAKDSVKSVAKDALKKTIASNVDSGHMTSTVRLQIGFKKGTGGWVMNGETTSAELSIAEAKTVSVPAGAATIKLYKNDGYELSLSQLNNFRKSNPPSGGGGGSGGGTAAAKGTKQQPMKP